jgi:lipid A oxidase
MRATAITILTTTIILGIAPQTSKAEWFFDGYLGKSATQDADLKINQAANASRYKVKDLSFDDDSFKSPPYYGVRLGYFFSSLPSLGVSFDFFHLKVLANTGESKRFIGTRNGAPIDTVQSVNSVIQTFNVSHGVNYLTLNAILRKGFFAEPERFPHGRLQGYMGAGPGLVIAHPENQVEGVNNRQRYEFSGVGVHAFAGIKWLLFRNFGLFGEYKFSHSRLDVNLRVGDAKTNENSHTAAFGVTVPFFY